MHQKKANIIILGKQSSNLVNIFSTSWFTAHVFGYSQHVCIMFLGISLTHKVKKYVFTALYGGKGIEINALILKFYLNVLFDKMFSRLFACIIES